MIADVEDWRAELEALVVRAAAQAPAAEVARSLTEAAGRLAAGDTAGGTPPVDPVRPEAPVLGVVACPAGWVGVAVGPTGRATVHVGSKVTALVEQVRETGALAAVAIDATAEVPVDTRFVGVEVIRVDLVPAWFGNGVDARSWLAGRGLAAPAFYAGSGFAEDELLRAAAAVLVALGRAG